MDRVQRLLILCFAFTGNLSVLSAYSYPAGFILAYFEMRNINVVAGSFAVSICQITSVLSPWIVSYTPQFKRVGFKTRSLVLCLISASCSAVLGYLDNLGGTQALVLLGVSRALLGAALGVFFVMVQGEVVDRYFKDNKTMVVLIGSGVYAGNTIGAIFGTVFFVMGGWGLTGPLNACFHLAPLLFLPCIKTDYGGSNENTAILFSSHSSVEMCGPTDKLSLLQCVAYYVPDFVFFMNNVGFSVLTYAIPLRMVEYNGTPMDVVVYQLNIICSLVIVPGITCAYFINKKMSVFVGMIVANVCFYLGCLLMFASTTPYASFHYDFEISSAVVGLSDACITNFIIISKFIMFEKWMIDITNIDLATHATTVFNVSDSLGHIVGAVISGLAMGSNVEIATLSVFCGFMIATTFSLLFTRRSTKVETACETDTD